MEGSVLNFLKAEWKVSDTGSAHWASSLSIDEKFWKLLSEFADCYEIVNGRTNGRTRWLQYSPPLYEWGYNT
jgi:hypothetical protein